VSTKSFVGLIVGNSKSNHLGAQDTFKPSDHWVELCRLRGNQPSLTASYREKKTRSFRVELAIFLSTRRVLPLFRVNPAHSFNQPVILSGAPVSINRRVNLGLTRGNRGRGREKNRKIGVFFSRYLAANYGGMADV